MDDFTWEVTGRPLSLHMNELVRLGTLPQQNLPASPFDTASSYSEALAELQISHLLSQRNDAVSSVEDCQRKFVARFLFRKIIRTPRLRSQWIFFENGLFPIWCDDLRPGNVVVDADLKIAGVLDWEFTYAAPVEFAHAPPWWLILEKPEYWPGGLGDWCKEYEKRLQIFLKAMADCGEKALGPKLPAKQRLSVRKQHSWESGDFWIMYAARDNFAFDAIYWEEIGQRFFAASTTQCDNVCDKWKERLDLLEPHEKELMHGYVDVKLAETKTKVLACDADEYTLECLHTMAV